MDRRSFLTGTLVVAGAAVIPALPAIAESKYLTITFADMMTKAFELMDEQIERGHVGLPIISPISGKSWHYASTEAYKVEAMKQGKLLQLIVPEKYWTGIQSYSPYFVPDRIVVELEDGGYQVVKDNGMVI